MNDELNMNTNESGKSNSPITYIVIGVCAIAALAGGIAVGKGMVKNKELKAAQDYIEWESQNHTWVKATCTTPKTCSVCGITEGEPLAHDWLPATMEASRTCSLCGATEGDPITMKISDWGYEELNYISQDYLMAKDASDEKYYLIDYDGNRISSDLIENNGWDDVDLDQDDGCFVVRSGNDSYIYDRSLSIINSSHSADELIGGYRDKHTLYYRMTDNGKEWNWDTGYDSFSRDMPAFYNGKIIGNWNFVDIPSRPGYYYCNCGSISESFNSLKNNKVIYYNDKPIHFNGMSSPDENGWIRAQLINMDLFEENDAVGLGPYESSGFYNLDTGDYVVSNNSARSLYINGTGKNGALVSVWNGLAVVIPDEYYASYKDGDPHFELFSLEKGDYVSDSYNYIEPSLNKLWLINNADEKWRYFDTESMTEVGEWSDSVSLFCNGYALILNDGKLILVNENLEEIGKAVDYNADEVSDIATEYLDYSDLGDTVLFKVKSQDEWHLVTFE